MVQLAVSSRDEGQHQRVARLLEVFHVRGIHREDGSGPGVPGIFRKGIMQGFGAASLVHRPRGAVVPVAFGEPYFACSESRDAVDRLDDSRGENVVAEHELLGNVVGFVLLGVVVVHRAAHADARVIIGACCGVDIRCERVAQADGVAHDEQVVGEEPEVALDARVFRGVGFEDGGKDAVLQPAGIEFGIGFLRLFFEHVPADVVAPIAVVDIRRGGCEVGQEG